MSVFNAPNPISWNTSRSPAYAIVYDVDLATRQAVARGIVTKVRRGELGLDTLSIHQLRKLARYRNVKQEDKSFFESVGWDVVEGACLVGPVGRQQRRARVAVDIVEVQMQYLFRHIRISHLLPL